MVIIAKRTIKLKDGVTIAERDKDFLITELDEAIDIALCELGFRDSVEVIKE